MLNIRDARLFGYHSGNGSTARADADYYIPAKHIAELSVSERANELKDSGKITITNNSGRYTGEMRSGDRVEFWFADQTMPSGGDRYGRSRYGRAVASGGGLRREWTGYIRPSTSKGSGAGRYAIEATIEDFVFAILSTRQFSGAFRDAPICGPQGAVLNEALRVRAPEIDRSRLPDMSDKRITLKASRMSLLDILRTVLERADCIAYADGTALVVEDPEALSERFEMTPATRDYGQSDFERNDDGLINRLQVTGGPSPELETRADFPTVDHYATVTESSVVWREFIIRKASVAEIEAFTQPTGSEEDVSIALQAGDGSGAPVAPTASKSDIDTAKLSYEFLDGDGSDGDGTQFQFGNHTLPGSTVYAIARSGGADGQKVGVDANGNLAMRAFYPFPTAVEIPSRESMDLYRPRDGALTDESLTSTTEAQAVGEAKLRHQAYPDTTFKFDAHTPRAHRLTTGDLFRVDDEFHGVDDVFVVTKRDVTYSENSLQCNVTGTNVASL